MISLNTQPVPQWKLDSREHEIRELERLLDAQITMTQELSMQCCDLVERLHDLKYQRDALAIALAGFIVLAIVLAHRLYVFG